MNSEEAQTTKLKTIVRTIHNRENPYVQLNKAALWDDSLSLKATGLWARCLSYKDDWNFSISYLCKQCKEGRKAIERCMNELIEAGYVLRFDSYEKDQKGHFTSRTVEYMVFEFKLTDEEKTFYRDEFKKSFRNDKNGEVRYGKVRFDHLLKNNKSKEQDPKLDVPKKKESCANGQETDNIRYVKQTSEPAVRLATLLFEKLKELNPKIISPNMERWSLEMERMLMVDKRSPKEIEQVIAYLVFQHHNSKNDFTWSKAVVSPQKLRKHFASLYLEMSKKTPNQNKEESQQKQLDILQTNKKWAEQLIKSYEPKFKKDTILQAQDNCVIIGNRSRRTSEPIGYRENGFQEIIRNFIRKEGL